ncbi:MAG TPA: single-stranded DNA-binding protein [Clostridium sp.]|nr:single-stranded DNA-binding protein [Clostridium sp.]
MNTLQNNSVILIGEVVSCFTFSHEVRGEAFYVVNLAVKRLSEQADIIPLTISERLIDVTTDCMGRTLEVAGQFRSFNQQGENKKRLILSVFVREVFFLEEDFTDCTKSNSITLKGYLCKSPVYRKTPLGREIADLLLAVNRPYGKSDYIPCIAWGRNARYASGFTVGTRMEIFGRIQSREYTKKLSETDTISRTAYEVSVSNLEVSEDD